MKYVTVVNVQNRITLRSDDFEFDHSIDERVVQFISTIDALNPRMRFRIRVTARDTTKISLD